MAGPNKLIGEDASTTTTMTMTTTTTTLQTHRTILKVK
jgi:hypothetical protein